MAMQRFTVEVQPDFIERPAKARGPISNRQAAVQETRS
jgi:hypothetical protein